MKEQVFEYLNKSYRFQQVDDITMAKELKLPGRQIVINGQPVVEPDRTAEVHITYIGEGTFYNVGEEGEPIYGFKLDDGDDIWVENLESFKFWFDDILNKTNMMQ